MYYCPAETAYRRLWSSISVRLAPFGPCQLERETVDPNIASPGALVMAVIQMRVGYLGQLRMTNIAPSIRWRALAL